MGTNGSDGSGAEVTDAGAVESEVADPGSRERVPRAAASVILLRPDTCEVLLLRRSDESAFVPGAWVFPGGALDESDARLAASMIPSEADRNALKICGIRETLEETGIWLGAPGEDPAALRSRLERPDEFLERHHIEGALEGLVPVSRWITPAGLPRRYDTLFFVAAAPECCEAVVDGTEGTAHRWIRASEALAENSAGRLKLVFPTIHNLHAISAASDVGSLIDSWRGRQVPVFRPRLEERDGRARIVLPEQEGA